MRKAALILFSIFIFTGCGKSGSSPAAPDLAKLALISPAQNEICTQGAIISTTQSTVTLKWAAAANSNSYDVNIKNLGDLTTISQTTTNTQVDVILNRNTPYSWSVTSKSSASTSSSQSDVWKFYNSGVAITSYAPFPADISSPLMGQAVTAINGKITLSWTGSDVDNDIVSYDVYLGNLPIPDLLQSNINQTSLNNVSISAGKTYYWKVVTKDSKGNLSDSGVYRFTTN